MITNSELGRFLKKYGNATFIVETTGCTIKYCNDFASEFYGVTEETENIAYIFKKAGDVLKENVKKILEKQDYVVFYDRITSTADGKTQFADIQFDYFDEERTCFFVEIRPKVDSRMVNMIDQMNQSLKPMAILDFNKELSIIHCNNPLHEVFISNEELRHSHFKNHLINGFLPEEREKLICSMFQKLSITSNFTTKIRVFTATGEEKWYLVEMDRRTLDQSGTDKIVAYLTNIEKQVETEEKFDLVNQYLAVVQESTVDLLYRVDIATDTMYSYYNFDDITDNDKVIPDYVNTFFTKDTIHPEDKEIYLKGFHNFYEHDIQCPEPVRFSLGGKPYQWYKITAKKIFDKEGNLKEVFGSLVNVDKETTIQGEVSTLNQYLDAFQAVSHESFSIIDLENMTIAHKGAVAKELGIEGVMENFPECTFDFVHPEDLSNFQAFTGESVEGEIIRVQARMKTTKGDYQWYEISSQGIKDKNGNVTQMIGKIGNIQKQKEIQEEMSILQKYFDVLQEFTEDILYRIDVTTQTLYHAYQSERFTSIGMVIPNYLTTLVREEIIHPDDAEFYIQNAKDWFFNEDLECEVRMNLVKDEYSWYSIKRRKVFDENGKLVEIVGALVNVQKEREIQAEYSELNQFFTAMQEMDNDVVFRIDLPTMTFSFRKQIAPDIWEENEIPDFFNTFKRENQVHPDDRERYFRLSGSYFDGSVSDSDFSCEVRFALVTDYYVWYSIKCKKIYNKEGIATEVYGKLLNIDTEKEITKGYSHLNQYFSVMQELSSDILFHIDIETMTFHHNDRNASKVVLSYDIPDFMNIFIEKNIIHPDCHESYRKDIGEMVSGKKMEFQVLSLTAPEIYEWYHVQGRFIQNEQGKLVEIFGKMTNIQAQRELEKRAYHDLMTGALNKATFEEEAKTVLLNTELDRKYALIFIDLDDFKGVNDTLGHSYGDALLSTVGKRLKRLVRGDDLVGRIGGDEFAVMLRNIYNEESVLIRTNLMLESLRRNFSFEKKVISIKASVGVALYPEHGTTYKELIGKADMAVYQSKREGKNKVSMYSEALEVY